MSAFLTPLRMELMVDPQGRPLLTRQGRQLYRLLALFRYQSDVVAQYRRDAGISEPNPSIQGLMEAEAGYVTDLCSQPQATLSLLGETGQEPSVPHDKAYSSHCIPRNVADKMLYEACLLTGIPKWKAALIYAGVRIGGGSHWSPDPQTAPSNDQAQEISA